MSAKSKCFPLSPQQARIWSLGPSHPGLVAQVAVAIDGSLDVDRLQRCMARLIDRHEILRTTFRDDTPDGPVQSVNPRGELLWRQIDFHDRACADRDDVLAQLLRDARREPIDVGRAPGLHPTLVQFGDHDNVLLMTVHALHGDASSMSTLACELASEYAVAGHDDDGVPPLQYGDVTLWQNHAFDSTAPTESGLQLWRRQVTATSLDPGIALLTPALSDRFDPDCIAEIFDSVTNEGLEALATGRAEPFLALCWHLVVHRLAGGAAVTICMHSDGRHYPELTQVLGPLTRYLPLRLDLSADEPFAGALDRMGELLADARDWQECFTWEVVSDAPPDAVPVCFEFADDPLAQAAADCSFRVAARYAASDRFRVRLSCRRQGSTVRLELHYDTEALSRSDAKRVLAQVRRLVGGAAAAPDAALAMLRSVDPAEERRVVVELNETSTVAPSIMCLHELIAERALRQPGDVALSFRDERMTYGQLDAKATRLARTLGGLGVGRENRIVVCLERSPDLVVALLGVLKAGAAYVPVDPDYPRARVELILRDSGTPVVLTSAEMRERLPRDLAHLVAVDDERDAMDDEPDERPAVRSDPAGLAYVVYTSGSTGVPKGVMVTHRALANYVSWCGRAYSIGEGSGAPVHSPIGFDLTVTALWGSLASGRTVVLIPQDEGLGGLATVLRSGPDFSVVKLTPSQLDVLSQLVPADAAASCTRAFVVGGEALTAKSIAFWRQYAPATRIFNEYGPTEATVGCSVYEVSAVTPPEWRVPIGRPAANNSVYILDPDLNPVPIGVPGELYVGGPSVARGYLDRPVLTAECFVPDPFSGRSGARLYRTGDRARVLRDGNLEFLDRIDRQVKIRGFRVEPEEVERTLAQHPAVERSVAVVREEAPGRRLVVYCARQAAAETGPAELREFLAERLPAFMVPADVILLDTLPLSANGKVDVEALPLAAPIKRPYVAPRTPTEHALARIWSDILGIDHIGVYDNFFELGGQSMAAARVVFLVRDMLQTDVPLRTVFEAPTIASLSEAIGADPASRRTAEAAALIAIEVASLTEDEVLAALTSRELGAG